MSNEGHEERVERIRGLLEPFVNQTPMMLDVRIQKLEERMKALEDQAKRSEAPHAGICRFNHGGHGPGCHPTCQCGLGEYTMP